MFALRYYFHKQYVSQFDNFHHLYIGYKDLYYNNQLILMVEHLIKLRHLILKKKKCYFMHNV